MMPHNVSPSIEWLMWATGFLGIPLAIGLAMRADWLDILKAFAILGAICALIGFTYGDTLDHRLMWTAIMWMVSCIPGIPLILFLMRLAGWR